MGVRVASGDRMDGLDEKPFAVLYDSVTGTAFGPMFESEEEALTFTRWCEVFCQRDPRQMGDHELGREVDSFRRFWRWADGRVDRDALHEDVEALWRAYRAWEESEAA